MLYRVPVRPGDNAGLRAGVSGRQSSRMGPLAGFSKYSRMGTLATTAEWEHRQQAIL